MSWKRKSKSMRYSPESMDGSWAREMKMYDREQNRGIKAKAGKMIKRGLTKGIRQQNLNQHMDTYRNKM